LKTKLKKKNRRGKSKFLFQKKIVSLKAMELLEKARKKEKSLIPMLMKLSTKNTKLIDLKLTVYDDDLTGYFSDFQRRKSGFFFERTFSDLNLKRNLDWKIFS